MCSTPVPPEFRRERQGQSQFVSISINDRQYINAKLGFSGVNRAGRASIVKSNPFDFDKISSIMGHSGVNKG